MIEARCGLRSAPHFVYVLGLALLLVAFVGWGLLHPDEFVRDDDEGMNLMKAQLVRAGYELYRDIWSDQPPLFTWLLAAVFNVFGPSVSAGRVLVLAFASIALLSVAWISRCINGQAGSVASVLFLATSHRFPALALSVRIDMPAMALAFLAMAFTLYYLRKNERIWLLPAGIAFVGSLLTKPMGVYLMLPILLALFLRARRGVSFWRALTFDLGLLAMIAIAALVICVMLVNGYALMEQIVGTELRSQQIYALKKADTLERLGTYVWDAGWSYWGLIALAAVGALSLRTARQRDEVIVVLATLVCTLGVLMTRTPLRQRYLVLLSVVLSVLAGAAVDDVIRRLCRLRSGHGEPPLLLALGLGLVLVAFVGVGQEVASLVRPISVGRTLGDEAVQFIVHNTSPQAYIVCDEGMITFRSGRRTPPSLSVLSGRRIQTGGLTVEELINITQTYKPEAIVLWEEKLTSLPGYIAWVQAHYHLARAYDDRHQIFLARSLPGGG